MSGMLRSMRRANERRALKESGGRLRDRPRERLARRVDRGVYGGSRFAGRRDFRLASDRHKPNERRR